MNILYASDNTFVEILLTSLISLIENNLQELHIFIFSTNISLENKTLLKGSITRVNTKLTIIDVPNIEIMLNTNIDISRYSLSMFSRFLVGSLLPANVQRIIYLDCDTLVLRNIQALYDYNLGGNVLGAVNDIRNHRYCRNLGMAKKESYINSGVLLIDLALYRAGMWQEKLFKALKIYNGFLEFPDNDLLCKIMAKEITLLPFEYNSTSVIHALTYDELYRARRPEYPLALNDYKKARYEPIVVYFTTCELLKGRPWHNQCNHPLSNVYLNYRLKSMAKTKILWQPEENLTKRFIYACFNFLPRSIRIYLFGIIHGIIKPDIQYITRKRYKKIFHEGVA